jgi:hypothetical protein
VLTLAPSGRATFLFTEVEDATRRSNVAGEQMAETVRVLRSYVVGETDGSLGMLCVLEAASPEAVRRHAAAAALPVDEIVAVANTIVVSPDPLPVAS